MKRDLIIKITKMFKKSVVGLVLLATLMSGTVTSFAGTYIQPYQLKESSVVYHKNIHNQAKILLDFPHYDNKLDSGCSYEEYTERAISQSITEKVSKILIASDIEVEFIRDKNTPMTIKERVDKANKTDYDYFISLHINSSVEENSGTGIEAFSNSSWSLAKNISNELQDEFSYDLRRIEATPYYNKYINKSVIYEMGFLNNSKDRSNLINKQDEYAKAIADGIIKQLESEGFQVSKIN